MGTLVDRPRGGVIRVALAVVDEAQRKTYVPLLLEAEHEAERRLGRSRFAQRDVELYTAGKARPIRCIFRPATSPGQPDAAGPDLLAGALSLEARPRVRREALYLLGPLLRPEYDGRGKDLALAFTHATTISASGFCYRRPTPARPT